MDNDHEAGTYPDITDDEVAPGMEAAVAEYRAINAKLKANVAESHRLNAAVEDAYLRYGVDSPECEAASRQSRENQREWEKLADEMDALFARLEQR